MKRYSALIIISIVSFILFLSCGDSSSPVVHTKTGNADSVKVLSLTKKRMDKTLIIPAELLAYETAEIFPKISGYVKQMNVDIGSKVKQGEILVVLEAPETKSTAEANESGYQSMKAKYESSLDNYNRLLQASKESGTVAEVELAKAKNQMLADSTAFLSAHFAAVSSRQVSDYLVIRAPFNGIITRRVADPGNLVSPLKSVLILENNNLLRLRVPVPEIYTTAELKNNSALFTIDALPQDSFAIHITRKAGRIDPETKTELWEFDYQNKGDVIKPGMYTNVKLSLSRNQATFFVPVSAIVTTQERKFVIRVENGKTEWIDIRQGVINGTQSEIFGDLHESDKIVTNPSEELKPGTSVKPY